MIGLMSCATSSDGDVLLLADPAHERRDAAWLGRSRLSSGSSSSSSCGPPDERLRDQQPLLLAAGELADRPARVGRRRRRARSPPRRGRVALAARAPRKRDPPAGAVEPEPDEVDAADSACRRRSSCRCGQVADPAVRLAGRPPQHRCRPAAQRDAGRATALISVDLPAPFGPSTATNSPSRDGERDVAPDRPPAERRPPSNVTAAPSGRRPVSRRGHRGHRPVACASARGERLAAGATCHAWKLADAGASVSVIVVTGMPSLARGVGDPLDVGRAVLAVEHPDLDLLLRDLAVDRRLVRGGRLGSFADRLEERGRRHAASARAPARAGRRCSPRRRRARRCTCA